MLAISQLAEVVAVNKRNYPFFLTNTSRHQDVCLSGFKLGSDNDQEKRYLNDTPFQRWK